MYPGLKVYTAAQGSMCVHAHILLFRSTLCVFHMISSTRSPSDGGSSVRQQEGRRGNNSLAGIFLIPTDQDCVIWSLLSAREVGN